MTRAVIKVPHNPKHAMNPGAMDTAPVATRRERT